MNIDLHTSDLADTIVDLSSDATSAIASALDEITDRMPDVPDPRRARRTLARVTPGLSTGRIDTIRARASWRWLIVGLAAIGAVAVVAVLWRRSSAEPDGTRRDDWSTPSSRIPSLDDRRREPAAANA